MLNRFAVLGFSCPVLQAAAENAALRALKQAKQAAEQEAEAAAKRAELAAAAADPWLNEDTNQAASALSPVRVRAAAACGPAQHPGYGRWESSTNNCMHTQGVHLSMSSQSLTATCSERFVCGWCLHACRRCARIIGRA